MPKLPQSFESIPGKLDQSIAQLLSHFKAQGLYRQRHLIHPIEGVNFCSNDYLSLAAEPRIKDAFQGAFQRYPVGSSGSMMLCGYHPAHQALEQAFKEALAVDDCIVFSSGYAANVSLVMLLQYLNAHILVDKGIHASIYDGLRSAPDSYTRYLHNNLHDLALKIKAVPIGSALITESIFSMSGQITPLAKIAALTKQHQCALMVDEAYAFGVLGPQGLGGVVGSGLSQEEVPLRVIPLGKAYAASGAIVAGQKRWIEALLQCARPLIYSTAISPAYSYGLLETLQVIREADARREKLKQLVDYFRQAILHSPLQWGNSFSPIQQLQLGCPHRAVAYANALREKYIICLPIRPPTVQQQHSGLRVILNYAHQPEQLDYFFKCLTEIHGQMCI